VASTPSSLVLGVVSWLPAQMIAPFASSLRASPYQGRFGLVLGDGYTPADVAAMAQLADFVVEVADRYRRPSAAALRALAFARATRGVRRAYPLAFRLAVAAGRDRQARFEAFEYRLEGLQALRYRHYLEVLEGEGSDADYVLISDLRDVLFQGDPFDPPPERLEVYLEEPHMTVAEETFTSGWIRDLYGERELERIGARVTSCSGTVAGPRDELVRYLRKMAPEIARARRPLGSHDQAVHNHLLYSGELDPVRILANGEGRVLTMAEMTRIDRDGAGRVLRADGSVPAVLHQYDRFPPLAAELLSAVRERNGF
jgi:hypothetical protein